MRVAAGALARGLLTEAGVEVRSHVLRIGGASLHAGPPLAWSALDGVEESPVRCADPGAATAMIAEIDKAKKQGHTVGGIFEVVVRGLPPGLGSFGQWDRKLDGRLAQALMSIPAIKAVGIGRGPAVASLPGSRIHDEILPPSPPSGRTVGVSRPTNNAGGLEGGVTNGEDLRVTGYMKPIATLMKPLRSVDLAEMTESPATIERSDVCAISAAAVVGEAVVTLALADAFLEKFSGDSLGEIRRNYQGATEHLQSRFHARRP
jgi:chorismate synthase